MEIYDKFILRSITKCLKLWLMKRHVKMFGVDEPTSNTTFLCSIDQDSNYDVVEALDDTRNESFGKIVTWAESLK